MAYYLLRAKYARDSMNALVQHPEGRMLTTARLLKEVGGRLHYFFCFGEYDIVLLFELPDNVSAASLAMTMSAAGIVTETETLDDVALVGEAAAEEMDQERVGHVAGNRDCRIHRAVSVGGERRRRLPPGRHPQPRFRPTSPPVGAGRTPGAHRHRFP